MKTSQIHTAYIKHIIAVLFVSLILGCGDTQKEKFDSTDETAIRQIHEDYVSGWLETDEEKIMGLLEENSRIQPNRLAPIEGKDKIREFWFPKDGSKTTINEYKTEIISLDILDSLAITTHSSLLDWSYQKDSTNFGMRQKGFNTTLYRKQKNGSWKIWRSMWTDIYAKPQ
ncbi:hypothetical protein GWK08_06315 [Leptobacterium flavescens]|uniref:DUF4440 domain-containing protein n=1 Tax=Leptobacterium flavescens TaxID=472055 RepID=A0A6P0UIC4_9FLAO|nr:DUF4440 domain-containing protein [Leptobacterium flavescens]NER13045.1 hypothetical protein [Leptobacterium flavescens]